MSRFAFPDNRAGFVTRGQGALSRNMPEYQ